MGDREEFLQIFQQHVTRPGSEKLLDWLDNKTDFFSAPASTRFHGACEGGLCMHSLNVYHANTASDDDTSFLNAVDNAIQLQQTVTPKAWSGTVAALQNKGRYAMTLQAPAPLRLTPAPGAGVMGLLSPAQIALGATSILMRSPDPARR